MFYRKYLICETQKHFLGILNSFININQSYRRQLVQYVVTYRRQIFDGNIFPTGPLIIWKNAQKSTRGWAFNGPFPLFNIFVLFSIGVRPAVDANFK